MERTQEGPHCWGAGGPGKNQKLSGNFDYSNVIERFKLAMVGETSHQIFVVFDSGDLQSVAQVIRKLNPDLTRARMAARRTRP